jgi:16S rRNA (guanine966-N2)-methyltransferase
MQIISGEFRGHPIEAPPGKGTRPMLGRVRQALFSTLGPGIEGAYVLDLFSGTGSLGLEAVSRGAAYVRLVEADPKVVKILNSNVALLGAQDRAKVMGGSAIEPMSWRPPQGEPDRWADCVFFDPPYPWLRDGHRVDLMRATTKIIDEVMRPGGLFVFHTPKRGVQASDFEARFEPDQRTYGSSALWYLRAPEADGDDEQEVEASEDAS